MPRIEGEILIDRPVDVVFDRAPAHAIKGAREADYVSRRMLRSVRARAERTTAAGLHAAETPVRVMGSP